MVTHFSNSYKPVQLLKLFFFWSLSLTEKCFCLVGRLYLDKMTDFETKELERQRDSDSLFSQYIIFKPEVQKNRNERD